MQCDTISVLNGENIVIYLLNYLSENVSPSRYPYGCLTKYGYYANSRVQSVIIHRTRIGDPSLSLRPVMFCLWFYLTTQLILVSNNFILI